MQHTSDTLRIYLDETQQGIVACPFCQEERLLTVKNSGGYLGGKTLKVKCKRCAVLFPAHFDYRRHPRIPVNVTGTLRHDASHAQAQDIVITSLSVSGLGFVVPDASGLQSEHTMAVTFTLDDPYKSALQEQVVIRRIAGNFVGAEYVRDDYCHELDFYVMRKPPLA